MKDPLTAVIVRHDLPGRADVFYAPELRLRGRWQDWHLLEAELQRRRGTNPEGGAAVGYFSYEGDFDFAFYPQRQTVAVREFLGQRINLRIGSYDRSGWYETVNLQQYRQMVQAAQESIRNGDIYQVNLARNFTREVRDFSPWRFFRILWSLTTAPLTAYYQAADRVLMSASPELFLALQQRRLITQPIKGTRPRSTDAVEDQRLFAELCSSAKERAELVMITDLERNDLGQICEYGSVQVSQLLSGEKLSHVFHLMSTVEGKLRPEVSAVQAVRACFPGGSITGAPKQRAMEIIAELEPFTRGFFTGAMGFFAYDGSAQFNIAIRTAEYRQPTLSFMTGSGITIGSNADEEFAETEHKARALQEAWAHYAAVDLGSHEVDSASARKG